MPIFCLAMQDFFRTVVLKYSGILYGKKVKTHLAQYLNSVTIHSSIMIRMKDDNDLF